jgi:hypothetical protein
MLIEFWICRQEGGPHWIVRRDGRIYDMGCSPWQRRVRNAWKEDARSQALSDAFPTLFSRLAAAREASRSCRAAAAKARVKALVSLSTSMPLAVEIKLGPEGHAPDNG